LEFINSLNINIKSNIKANKLEEEFINSLDENIKSNVKVNIESERNYKKKIRRNTL
jgi:ribosomal protein S13